MDDLQAELARFAAQGLETALYAETAGAAVAFAMVDAVASEGVFFELYEPSPPITALYDRVKRARNRLGADPVVRPMADLALVDGLRLAAPARGSARRWRRPPPAPP